MSIGKGRNCDRERDYAEILPEETVLRFGACSVIYRQGEPADAVFLLRQGRVKLAAISGQGKEVCVAMLNAGNFFGEGCLAGQSLRIAMATALDDITVARIEKKRMERRLHEQPAFLLFFARHLLSRNLRYEEDLIGLFFDSSEKRLARVLLLLARYGAENRSETVNPRISQEALARKIGIPRSRVVHLLSKFKRLGFIDYGSSCGLTVKSGLLGVILHNEKVCMGEEGNEKTNSREASGEEDGQPVRKEGPDRLAGDGGIRVRHRRGFRSDDAGKNPGPASAEGRYPVERSGRPTPAAHSPAGDRNLDT